MVHPVFAASFEDRAAMTFSWDSYRTAMASASCHWTVHKLKTPHRPAQRNREAVDGGWGVNRFCGERCVSGCLLEVSIRIEADERPRNR